MWKLGVTTVLALLFATAHGAAAHVLRIDITQKISPAFDGRSFGSVGPYEELDGVAYGEVDPKDPRNALIQDLQLAPRNARGMVEYAADVAILKPLDERNGNHTMLYEASNRGRAQAPGYLNAGTTAANPSGDGFIERNGFTFVRSGWQGDVARAPGIVAATVPELKGITEPVRTEFDFSAPALAAELEYAPALLDTTRGALTQRVHVGDPRQPVASADWAYALCDAAHPFPGTPDAHHVCLRGGFDTNHIYELQYQARDPLVLGLGLAAMRDVVSFLRHNSTAQNPLAGSMHHTVAVGFSQSGRLLRTLLQLGFNADESGRIVFDGMDPHIAVARVPVNVRFGQPSRSAGVQHLEHDFPGNEPPTTWETVTDPLWHTTSGILQRCRIANTCPKIVQTVTDTEYWQSGMSPSTAGAFGLRDLAMPPNVRVYHLASTQHMGYSPLGPFPPAKLAACAQLPDANPYTYNLRALLVGLTNWVTKGTNPPPSRYARVADGTLVRVEQLRFPTIPGAGENVAAILDRGSVWDHGRRFNAIDESGVMAEPPLRVIDDVALVPQVDADGNDVDGVRSTTLQAPLGTYTGWNTRSPGFSAGDACDIVGSFIPFARTAAERQASGDPRLSLEERYANHAGYVAAVTSAARRLVADGFLLPEDATTSIAQAEASDVLK